MGRDGESQIVSNESTLTAPGPRDVPGSVLGIPRLEPRPDAFLKLGNYLTGDALIDICFHCLLFFG
jgi:hypothetical protein